MPQSNSYIRDLADILSEFPNSIVANDSPPLIRAFVESDEGHVATVTFYERGQVEIDVETETFLLLNPEILTQLKTLQERAVELYQGWYNTPTGSAWLTRRMTGSEKVDVISRQNIAEQSICA